MLLQRINRTNAEKVFIVAKNSWDTASLTNGQAVIWDFASDADGIGVTKPIDATTRAGSYGAAFAGIATTTIATGAYGLLQVYGYHSAVMVKTHTGGNPAVAAGTGLACVDAVFALTSYPAAAATTSTITLHNADWVGFALAVQASSTAKAIAAFIKGL